MTLPNPSPGEIVALSMTPGRLFGGAVWRDARFANELVLMKILMFNETFQMRKVWK